MSIGEKPPKRDEKTRRKTKGLIKDKSPQLDEETKRKTGHFVVL